MSEQQLAYIAGVGMITSIGANAEMTAAAVKSGISGYAVSDFYSRSGEPVTMASVPDGVFAEFDGTLDEGDRFNECHDRVVKMAIIAAREACSGRIDGQSVALLMCSSDMAQDEEGLSPLITDLETNCKPWINAERYRNLRGDRAVGIEAIDYYFRHIDDVDDDFVLIGGSDSFHDQSRLDVFDREDRLLTQASMDGFAPGEAACFILLTRRAQLAWVRDGHIVALNQPGITDEPGHLGNETAYRGDGLDQAFKQVCAAREPEAIERIYSSMNGESHWAKEYGVAFTRNRSAFSEPVEIEHPADQLGDVGSATSVLLIALAADDLFSRSGPGAHLVYSSSDSARRGAIVVEKMPAAANEPQE